MELPQKFMTVSDSSFSILSLVDVVFEINVLIFESSLAIAQLENTRKSFHAGKRTRIEVKRLTLVPSRLVIA